MKIARIALCCGAMAVGCWVSGVQAVVTTIGATVSAEVRQTSGGSTINSDTSFDQLDLTTFNLPLVAAADLTTDTIAAAANTKFSDPRLVADDRANEFALSAVGFNQETASVLAGDSIATETREVVFGASEVGLSNGTAVEAQSYFFLNGIMILLAKAGQTDYTGAKAETHIRVIQERDGVDPATVLEATVTLTGNADGTATLAVDGAVTADNLTTFGLAAGTANLPGFQAVLLPDLAIPYVYPASIDETFRLRAEITTRYESPNGTGAVNILGDGLNDLLALMTAALGTDITSIFSGGISGELTGISLPTNPLIATARGTTLKVVNNNQQGISVLPCGAMGAESALLAIGLCGLAAVRSRRPR